MVHSQDWHDSTGFASLYRNQAEITVLMREWPGTTGSTLQGKEGKKSVSEASRAPSLPLGPLCLVILVVCLLPPVRTPGPNVWMGWKRYDFRTGAKAIQYRIKWGQCLSSWSWTLDRKFSVKRRNEWTDCLAVVSCSHSYRCSNLC